MPSFLLRHIDAALMDRVKARAEAEGVTVKAAILNLMERYGENVMATTQPAINARINHMNAGDRIVLSTSNGFTVTAERSGDGKRLRIMRESADGLYVIRDGSF